MLKRILPMLLVLSMLLTLLPGCDSAPSAQQTQQTEQTDTAATTLPRDDTVSTEASTPSTEAETVRTPEGSLLTEPLTTVSWDSGRTNETSQEQIWETENGYYFSHIQLLYYADKTELSTWIPVCADPECGHTGMAEPTGGYTYCGAVIMSEYFLRDGRIWSSCTANDFEELPKKRSAMVYSMAMDGSDKRLEFVVESAEKQLSLSDTSNNRLILTPEYCIYSVQTLNTEGFYDIRVYGKDDEGEFVIFSDEGEENNAGAHPLYAYGERYYSVRALNPDSEGKYVHRLDGRELITLNITDLPTSGSYFTDDTARIFRTGEGYFDIDLETREETFLSPAQLENSVAEIMLPNCILESTLLDIASLQLREQVDTHRFVMFDGEKWMEVQLPEELVNAPDTLILTACAVTSDRIFVMGLDKALPLTDHARQLYQIRLDTDTPVLEYLGEIGEDQTEAYNNQ